MIFHLLGLVVFLAVLLIVAAANLFSLRRMEEEAASSPEAAGGAPPRVSILVPARDEERSIAACVRSLLAQQYPDFEVLVLDDGSTDATGQILAGIAAGDERLRLLSGAPLLPGWSGKSWACHQLAAAASGDVLLFTDADTFHHPQALAEAVAILQTRRLDLLSALPRQQTLTLGEGLVVPLLYWSFLAFVPLPLAYRLRLPALSMAIGQFMLFRRSAYDRVGGFQSVRANAADDLALARRVKACGLRWRLVDGGERVSCRMYHGFRESFQGLSKNLFAAFDYRLAPFLFVWVWLGIVFLEPPLLLAARGLGAALPEAAARLAAVALAEGAALWLLALRRFRFPLYLILFYPVFAATACVIAFCSLALALLRRARWKGRPLPPAPIRLW